MKTVVKSLSVIFLMGFILASCKKSAPSAATPSGLEDQGTRNAGSDVQQASQDFLDATRGDTSSDPTLDQAARDAANAATDANNPLNSPDAPGVIGAQVGQGTSDLTKDIAVTVLNNGPVTSCPKKAGLASSTSGSVGQTGQPGKTTSCAGGDNSKQNTAVILGVVGGLALLGAIGNYIGKDYFKWNGSIKEWRETRKVAVGAPVDQKAVDDLKQEIVEKTTALEKLISPEGAVAELAAANESIKFTEADLLPNEKTSLEKLNKGEGLTEAEIKTVNEVVERQKTAFIQERTASFEANNKLLANASDFPKPKDFLEFFEKANSGTEMKVSALPESIVKFLKIPPVVDGQVSAELRDKIIVLSEISHSTSDALTQEIVKKVGVVTPATGPSLIERMNATFGNGPKIESTERKLNALTDIYERLQLNDPANLDSILDKSKLEPAEKSIIKKLAAFTGEGRADLIKFLSDTNNKSGRKEAIVKALEALDGKKLSTSEVKAIESLRLNKALISQALFVPDATTQKPLLDEIVTDRVAAEANLKAEASIIGRDKIILQAIAKETAFTENGKKLVEVLSENHRNSINPLIAEIEERTKGLTTAEAKAKASAETLKKVTAYDKTIKATSGIGMVVGTVLVIAAISVGAGNQTTSLAETSNDYASMHTYEEKANHYKYKVLPAICKKHFPDLCSKK